MTDRARCPTADGDVRKVDKDEDHLRHSELKQLDMPPMTVGVQVKDPRCSTGKAGDK
jgi:Cu/Ag efflux protein CusF